MNANANANANGKANPTPPNPAPWWRVVWRALQAAVVLAGPLSTLAFCMAPVRYQCWWFGQHLAKLSWEWAEWLDEQPWCTGDNVSEFQIFAPLCGLIGIPVLALVLGWSARRIQLHWSARLAGGLYGALTFSTLVTYFFWLAGKS